MLVIFDDARAWQVGQGADRAMPLQPRDRRHVEARTNDDERNAHQPDERAGERDEARSDRNDPEAD